MPPFPAIASNAGSMRLDDWYNEDRKWVEVQPIDELFCSCG